MSTTIALCAADDVLEGDIRKATLPDGSDVALYKVDGRIYVTDDLCTHAGASLSEDGVISGKIVECTFHYGTFDVTTGEAMNSPCEVPLKTYPVRLIGGVVHIEV